MNYSEKRKKYVLATLARSICHKAVTYGFISMKRQNSVAGFIMMTSYGNWTSVCTDRRPMIKEKEASSIFFSAGGFTISKQ
jgi:hypothetical protein